jgi:hypothetical protein
MRLRTELAALKLSMSDGELISASVGNGVNAVVAVEIEAGVVGGGNGARVGVTGEGRRGRIRSSALSRWNGQIPVPEKPALIFRLEKAREYASQ